MNKDKRNNIQLLGTLNNADESGIIANANQIYDANEDKSTQDVSKEHTERIKDLETKENSMQTTLENISKTGEASAASNVTYNHSDSKLDATNVQQAVDEMRELINTHEGNIEELQDSVNEIKNQEIPVTDNGPDDFSIQDEEGNTLCLWKDGHIKTKNFDSEKVVTKEEVASIEHPVEVNENSDSDLDVADEKGNVLARFKDGHIKTKNFDSSEIPTNPSQAMSISLSGIYNRDNPFGVGPNIVYKDAAKRTLPNNVIPLIVIAGQSNADGRAPYNTASNWESTKWLADANYSVENYNMWKASVKTFETYNVLTNNGADSGSGSDGSGEKKFSFDPFFAKKFIEVFNTPLYAVRETLGGIGIGDYVVRAGKKNTWQPKIGYIENKYSVTDVNYLILRLLEKINDIKKWCNNNNKILFPIAILWHQGEHDADASLITNFKENTSEVISFMRGIFQAPALPFINGFVQNDYNANYAKVNQIFLELNEIDDYMKTVDMAGHYTSIGDGLHYNGQSLAYMGEQMFNYYKQLNSLI